MTDVCSTSDPATSNPPGGLPQVELPWSEEELRSVFNKFSAGDDREIHVENMVGVLEYLGARPDADEVEEVVVAYTRYSAMTWGEFLDFMRHWRERDLEQLREQFLEADLDGNALLDVKEVHCLLQESGYSPTEGVTAQAFRMTDVDQNGVLDFNEFERLREHLRKNRGFLTEEAEELDMIFRRVSGESGQVMPVEQIARIKRYLGFNIPDEECSKIVAKVDRGVTGHMSLDELLLVVRMMQDFEHSLVRKFAFESADPIQKAAHKFKGKFVPRLLREVTEGCSLVVPQSRESLHQVMFNSGRFDVCPLNVDQLDDVLAKMGYFASEDVVGEILQTTFARRADPDSLTLGEFDDFLRRYRQSEGFTKEETEDLRRAFKREQAVSVAGNNNDTLDVLELGRVLRWFGISKTVHQVKHLIDDVDFDGSRQLEFKEFQKLMRKFRQEDARQRRAVFQMLGGPRGELSVDTLSEAVEAITGHEPDPAAVAAGLSSARPGRNRAAGGSSRSLGGGSSFVNALNKGNMSRHEFDVFFKKYRERLRVTIRANAGYLPSEVLKMRAVFNTYDSSGNGQLRDADLRRLISDYMPESTHSTNGKNQVIKLLADLVINDDQVGVGRPRGGQFGGTTTRCTSGVGGLPSSPLQEEWTAPRKPSRKRRPPRRPQSGFLDFHNFLVLMRRACDQRDERDILDEEQAVRETSFQQDEIEAWRQVFLEWSNPCGEVDLLGVHGLLETITSIDEEELQSLASLIADLSPDDRQSLRFPQFLRLLHQLMAGNLFGLNETAEQVVSRDMLRLDVTRTIRTAADKASGEGGAQQAAGCLRRGTRI